MGGTTRSVGLGKPSKEKVQRGNLQLCQRLLVVKQGDTWNWQYCEDKLNNALAHEASAQQMVAITKFD